MMTATKKRAMARKSMHAQERSTKRWTPAPTASPETTAPVVDGVPRCALYESPATDGATSGPACGETDTVRRNASPVVLAEASLALDGGLTLQLSFDSESRPSITKTAAPLQRWPAPVAGEAMTIGAEVARYLKIHSRKPYEKEQDVQWMIDRARAAWHAALIETAAPELQA